MRTERGLDRLVTFLDAVVAIAITLLVLPLVEVLDAPQDDLGTVLREEWRQFGAFLLSFVVIARLWLVHHRLVERIGSYDSTLVLLGFAWILTIVVLPFATQVIAVYGTQRPAIALYIGTMTASSALLSALSLLLWRRPALRRAGADVVHPVPGMVTVAAFALALVVGVALPAVNYWGLLLLTLTGPAEAAARRRLDHPGQRPARDG
ncbi:TMEM175 family protein [Blastococcus sp. SYSU D00695]